MSDFLGLIEEIDRWYEENPDPSTYQVAERLIPLAVRRIVRLDADGYHAEDLAELTGYLHGMWIGEAITLRQAAEVAIPAVYEALSSQGRIPEMKAWMAECFFDVEPHGLDRDVAAGILRAHQVRQSSTDTEEGAA